MKTGLVRILFFIISFAASAQAELIIGAEFEFIDPRVPVRLQARGLKGHEQGMAERMFEAVRQQCQQPHCTYEWVAGKYDREVRFHLAEADFWFQISVDPNVVEVLTKPAGLSEYKKNADLLQKFIFDSAAAAGLQVDSNKRAGHFNFSVHSAFENRSDTFLKFILDFANRPELANGIFRETNILNSPHFASLEAGQRQNLRKLAQGYALASQKADFRMKTNSLKELIKIIWHKVFLQTHKSQISDLAHMVIEKVFYKAPLRSNGAHYQALGLKKIPHSSALQDAPFEIRSMRSQKDIQAFLLTAELIQARIAYLKSLPPATSYLYNMSTQSEFTPQDLVNRFYLYVIETGLDWEKYRALLPETLQRQAPSDFLFRDLPVRDLENLRDIVRLHEVLPTSPWLQQRLGFLVESGYLQGSELEQLQESLKDLASAKSDAEPALKKIYFNLSRAFPLRCETVFSF